MYLDCTVPVPDVPGKITVRKMGRHDCVLYETARTYDPKRKFNVPKRTVIGRRCADDPGRMVPNEKFLEFFPGTPVRASFQEALPEVGRSSCLRTGTHLVVGKIVRRSGLVRMLEDVLEDDAGFFLDLVSSLIVGETYPGFAFTHPLFAKDMAILGGDSACRWLSGISGEQIGTFLGAWNGLVNRGEGAWISCLSATGEGNRQSMGLAYSGTREVPLFYEAYPFPVPVPDTAFFQFMAGEASRYGCGYAGFVLTQESFSQGAVEFLDREHCPFVIEFGSESPLTASLAEAHRESFESESACFIGSGSVRGITVKGPLFPGDAGDRWLHLCFDHGRMARECWPLEWELGKIRSLLESEALGEERDALSERAAEIRRRLALCGYFVLASSGQLTAGEALHLCRRGKASARLFESGRAFPDSESQGRRAGAVESARLWASFVALIVRGRMTSRLRKASVGMSVSEAVRELEKVEMVRKGDGMYRPGREVTGKQRRILEAFGISGDELQKEMKRLSLQLMRAGEPEAEDAEEAPFPEEEMF